MHDHHLRLAALALLGPIVLPVQASPSFAGASNGGNVNSALITEASGLVGSRVNPGVLWTHNDSGGQPRIFGFNPAGQLLGIWTLPGATAVDYEDIAVGPGPEQGVSYLYVGDIGDNNAVRGSITVWRTPEPHVLGGFAANPVTRTLPAAEALTLNYEDGAHDAESLFIDPITGDLWIATKESGASTFYRAAAADLAPGAPITLTSEVSVSLPIFFQLATAADISARGNEILLRGYTFARLWERDPCEPLADALARPSQSTPFVSLPAKPQGEAMGFDRFGQDYYSLSEGSNQPVYRFARTSSNGPELPTQFIGPGSHWTWLDSGTPPAASWTSVAFNDTAWSNGPAPLGYGDGDEASLVADGGNPSARHPTTWFRHVFAVADPAAYERLTLLAHVDDGARFYLNGRRLLDLNLGDAAGPDDYAATERDALEDTWMAHRVSPHLLEIGDNVLAVEVHIAAPDSPDLSFDVQLLAYEVDADCNDNGVPDACDIATGFSLDENGDGRPDECDCGADVSMDGFVDFADLNIVLAQWESDGTGGGDTNMDGAVNFDDLNAVLDQWGRICP